MNQCETVDPGEHTLDAFEPPNRIAVLALNRDLSGDRSTSPAASKRTGSDRADKGTKERRE
jgi:hypothetical protein